VPSKDNLGLLFDFSKGISFQAAVGMLCVWLLLPTALQPTDKKDGESKAT